MKGSLFMKHHKLLSLILAAAISAGCILPISASAAVTGDINGDGSADSADLSLLQGYVLGNEKLTETQVKAADLNGDGKVTVTDAVMVINILLQQGQEVTSLQLFEGLEGEFTGIQHINSSKENHHAIFDLTGRQVKRPTKGVHIINGKKIVTK